MNTSLYLASVYSILLIVFGLTDIIHAKKWVIVARELLRNKPLMLVMELMVLIIGTLLVLSHNIWSADYRAVISLINWALLLQAIAYFLFPEWIHGIAEKLLSQKVFVWRGAVRLVIGLYFAFVVLS